MNCEQLSQLLPDLIDGTLAEETRHEAEEALTRCPDCQRQYDLARQIHAFLLQLQAENEQFRVPPDFEQRLMARIKQQNASLELFDLSSRAFADWLLELIKLVGGLLSTDMATQTLHSQPTS